MEMLTCLAIIAIVAALTLPALTSVGDARDIRSASNELRDQLNLARQHALARGLATQLRVFQVPDPNGGIGIYTSTQLVEIQPDGSTTSIAKVVSLPKTTAIASSYSTLITANPSNGNNGTIPGFFDLPYSPVTFLPDGSLKLPLKTSASLNWYFTIVSRNKLVAISYNAANKPAPNFATIQVDALTGLTREFTP